MPGQAANPMLVQFMLWDQTGRQGTWQAPAGERRSSFQLAFRNPNKPPSRMTKDGVVFKITHYADYAEGPRERHPTDAE